MEFKINEHQHRRFNPLKGEWILVSPHRLLRPWQGQTEKNELEKIKDFDLSNPLCPGAVRAKGKVMPEYKTTYTFTNDFPALLEDGPKPGRSDDPLFQIGEASGTCRVMCFHPRSSVHIATMKLEEIHHVIEEWINELIELGKKFNWVQIFENRGAMMGCSNPHPHCQIWASNYLPNEIVIKDTNLRNYYEKNGKPLLIDYMEKELQKKERIVCMNNDWIVVVPFWAVWPFETMILPRKQVARFNDLSNEQKINLARIMQNLVTKYDNIFNCPFPYSMGWHGAPTGIYWNENIKHWTFHGIYYPPLLRSSTIKKFMVGYELLAQSQRDLTPEKAANVISQQNETLNY